MRCMIRGGQYPLGPTFAVIVWAEPSAAGRGGAGNLPQ